MRYEMILALIASLMVATTNAGECLTTQDQYVTVSKTIISSMSSMSTFSVPWTSDSGKACMTYDEVHAQDPDGLLDRLFTPGGIGK